MPSANPAVRRARPPAPRSTRWRRRSATSSARRRAAPAGSRVTFELTGPAARTIHVEVGDRAKVVDELTGPATVTLTMPLGVFSRLAGGRADPGSLRGQVDIDGDVDLGERIVNNLAYTI